MAGMPQTQAAHPAHPETHYQPKSKLDGVLKDTSAAVATDAPRRRAPSPAGLAVLLVGLLVTAALAFACHEVYEHNERHLLALRVKAVGLVLTEAVPEIQTPLVSAAELANDTDGNPGRFKAFMAPYVGPKGEFASASLWPLGTAATQPAADLGTVPVLAPDSSQAHKLFDRSSPPKGFTVVSLLGARAPSIGYEFVVPTPGRRFAVFAESPLPANRRSRHESDSAFSDLDYAIYLGRSRSAANLLVTNLTRLPIAGRQASDVVPFGNTALTLVVTPRGSLGGSFFASLQWVVGLVGLVISLAAAFVAARLVRRRRLAEQLAGELNVVATENRRMYAEQQSIAQTLQHALMPASLPIVAGLDVSARYVPAGAGLDVGGDWYDVIDCADGGVLLVVGDVSGHGLTAATTMAALRHAALAYAALDCDPAVVLTQLAMLVNGGDHNYFATVLCVLIDVRRHRLVAASAGHLPPLLLNGDSADFLDLPVNVPIGVPTGNPYRAIEVTVPAAGGLLAYTDGLVERRGETIDTGLERLRFTATAKELPLDQLLTRVVATLTGDHNRDDTAIVGVKWKS